MARMATLRMSRTETGGSGTRTPESRPPALTGRTEPTAGPLTNYGRNMWPPVSRIRIIQVLCGTSHGRPSLISIGFLPVTTELTALFLTSRTAPGGSETKIPVSEREATKVTRVTRALTGKMALMAGVRTRCGKIMSKRQLRPAGRSWTGTATRLLLMIFRY